MTPQIQMSAAHLIYTSNWMRHNFSSEFLVDYKVCSVQSVVWSQANYHSHSFPFVICFWISAHIHIRSPTKIFFYRHFFQMRVTFDVLQRSGERKDHRLIVSCHSVHNRSHWMAVWYWSPSGDFLHFKQRQFPSLSLCCSVSQTVSEWLAAGFVTSMSSCYVVAETATTTACSRSS